MSGRAFDRLLYTDCRPGEGLGGGGGYQVQAQSEECAPAQVRMAVGSLLYSTQTRWLNERRSTKEFPLGLAHSADAGFGTAQSKYLGKEVNGNRQGNHLADCLLTEAVEPYGVIRPAQLWRAPFWREEIWPTTTAPRFEDGLDLGPLDHDAIAHWLHDAPGRAIGVERLLTVLEDPSGVRVAIRAESPESALYWIAAATILLPISDALRVSFRVFTNSIDDSPHRVVAVPKELHPNLTPGSRPRTFIIDATTDTTDEIAVSSRAHYWVQCLVNAGEPYDVVEAVEVAATFGGGNEQELSDARSAAMAVVDPGRPIDDVPGVGRWLRNALNTMHHDEAQSVVERLVASQGVRLDDLRLLDQLAANGMVAVNAEDLRTRLLYAEVQQALAGLAPPADKLDEVALSRVHRTDSQSAVVSAVISGADPTVDLLLRVAWRHGLELTPPSPALVDRLRTFVESWLRTPRAVFDVDRWALGEIITDELHGQLRGIWAAGDWVTLERVLRGTIHAIIRRANDLTDPFTFEIEAAYTSTIRPERRMARIRAVFAALGRAAHGGSVGHAPSTPFEQYQAALVRWHAVDPATAVALVSCVPAHARLNETVAKLAAREVEAKSESLDEATILAIEGLAHHKRLPDEPRLHRIARSATAVNDFLSKLESTGAGDPKALRAELKGLREADDDVVAFSIPAFTHSAATASTAEFGRSVLHSLRGRSGLLFARDWRRYIRDPSLGYVAATFSVAWARDGSIPGGVRSELGKQLWSHYQSLSTDDAYAWWTAVSNHLRSAEDRAFLREQLEGAPTARRRSKRWGRG